MRMTATDRSKGAMGSGGERGDGPADTLRGFLKRGEAFIEEILGENEALRLRNLQLESRLQDAMTPVPAKAAAVELRSLFAQLHREHEELRKRLDEVAEETEQYKARYQQIEEENDRLVNLFVSAHQLHSSLDLAEVVQIIVEILLNFIGASRFALLVWDAPTGRYRAIESYGLPVSEVPPLGPEDPVLKECLATRKPVVLDPASPGLDLRHPRVCVPLKLPHEVPAVATLYSYLEQKEGLSEIDRELFALLADHGGVVLESARLAAGSQPVESRFSACLALLKTGDGNHA
jgi:regulator of replication initiation timing